MPISRLHRRRLCINEGQGKGRIENGSAICSPGDTRVLCRDKASRTLRIRGDVLSLKLAMGGVDGAKRQAILHWLSPNPYSLGLKPKTPSNSEDEPISF